MSQGWYYGNRDWYPDLPIDPPTTDYDKYEYQWEAWLDSHYDKETNTIFGMNYGDADIEDILYDRYWDKFMDEVINIYYD